MARIEIKIENDVVDWAESNGWRVRKYTQPGRRGGFDRVFIKQGRVVWIEFKDPNGELSDLQVLEWKDLLDHDAEAYVCDAQDWAISILRVESDVEFCDLIEEELSMARNSMRVEMVYRGLA